MQKNIAVGFFQKETGRKLVFIGAGCFATGLVAVNFLPQTICLNYYREFVQCYEKGIERPVSKNVLERLEKAYDKLDITVFERKLIKPFTVFGFDIFQAGSTKYRFGCVLGIPANYNYSSVDDIKLSNIRFRNEEIKWNTDNGKLLQEAIVLTENEQTFGLCKAILQLQSHQVIWNTLFPTANFISMYAVGSYLNRKLNLFNRPFAIRFVMYTILGLFGIGMWTFMKDYNQVLYDSEIDKKLSSLGPEFVEAGIGYYDKLLKKNIALRALLGDDTYTSKGNENFLLRQKSLPITMRKLFFEEKAKENQQTEDSLAQ